MSDRIRCQSCHSESFNGPKTILHCGTCYAALRARLAEQTARAEKAERIGGNAVAQVAYMVAEINKTFGLNGDRTPADTVQSVREAVAMLNERDELRTQVADLTAKLARETELVAHLRIDLTDRDARIKELDHPRIATRCPSCGSSTLAIGDGNWLVCTLIGCKDPTMINSIGERHRLAQEDRLRFIAERDQLQATVTDQVGEVRRLRVALQYLADLGSGRGESNCFARQALTPPAAGGKKEEA